MISARHLFLAQRYSAMLLGPLVLIHLVMIILAVRNGLTAEEILSRTSGSFIWFVFYFLFVVAVTVHAPIGLRNILTEWTRLTRTVVNSLCGVFAFILFLTGLRAILAVT